MKNRLKITILLITGMFFTLSCIAQEYEYVPMPMQNAIWSQIYMEDYDTIAKKYALFDEDTILDGKTYQKLFLIKGDTVLNRDKAYLVAFIREENKKVYKWGVNAGGEMLIYNFDINEGDTLGVEFGYLFSVKKVDTIIVNNTKRRRFHFRIGDYDFNDLIWIEGIGAIRGLFTNTSWPVGHYSTLVCMTKDNTIEYYYDEFGTCYPDYPDGANVINTINKNNELNIYPNPVSNNLFITTPVLKSGVIEILSIYGKLLIKEEIQPKQLKISIGSIQKGIYIVKYTSFDNEIYIRKFIKE